MQTQSYSADSFDELARGLSTGKPTCIVFVGTDKKKRQEALSTLTDHLPYNLHQVQTGTLVGDRYIETQGNLREMFDNTGEEGNVLVFEKADALYEMPGADERHPDDEDEEAMTPAEYVFERIGSYKGVVVLSFQDRAYADEASQREAVNYMVTF